VGVYLFNKEDRAPSAIVMKLKKEKKIGVTMGKEVYIR